MRTDIGPLLSLAVGAALLVGCQPRADVNKAASGLGARDLADALHAVLSADREVYTKEVVNRLQNEDKVVKAGEHWKEDKLLPLPAQMFRMGAARAREKTKAFAYALLSPWPINKQNGPHTEAEKAGLEAVAAHPEENRYSDETLSGVDYLTAIYPDRAVSPACIDCHNGHPDSPRKDWKLGDVMGAVVIRVVKR
jgi:uncharacterized protein DUF3365